MHTCLLNKKNNYLFSSDQGTIEAGIIIPDIQGDGLDTEENFMPAPNEVLVPFSQWC